MVIVAIVSIVALVATLVSANPILDWMLERDARKTHEAA